MKESTRGGWIEMLIVGALPPADYVAPIPEFSARTTMSAIQRRGCLRVAISTKVPCLGYQYPESGRIAGYEIDLACLIARDIFGGRVEDSRRFVELVPSNLAERMTILREDRADIVLANCADTPERRTFADFAGHYMMSPHSLLMSAGSPTIDHLEDLRGVRVAVVTATTNADDLPEAAPGADIVELSGVTECLDALRDGTVEAFWANVVANNAFVKHHGPSLRQTRLRRGKWRWGIGLRKGDLEFKRFLNDEVSSLLELGHLNAALRRWLG